MKTTIRSSVKSPVLKNFVVKSTFANKLRKTRNPGFVNKSLKLSKRDLEDESRYLNHEISNKIFGNTDFRVPIPNAYLK